MKITFQTDFHLLKKSEICLKSEKYKKKEVSWNMKNHFQTDFFTTKSCMVFGKNFHSLKRKCKTIENRYLSLYLKCQIKNRSLKQKSKQ